MKKKEKNYRNLLEMIFEKIPEHHYPNSDFYLKNCSYRFNKKGLVELHKVKKKLIFYMYIEIFEKLIGSKNPNSENYLKIC